MWSCDTLKHHSEVLEMDGASGADRGMDDARAVEGGEREREQTDGELQIKLVWIQRLWAAAG